MEVKACTVLRRASRFVSGLEITAGIACVASVSCAVTGVAACLHTAELSLTRSVFHRGHVHRLLTYCFYHADAVQLLLGVALLGVFCGGMERGVGTVRFLHLLVLLSSSVGVLYILLEPLLLGAPGGPVSGLVPVSLAMLGVATVGSRMRKAYLMGLSVPTATLPWILALAVTLMVPGAVPLCNVLAVAVGQMYGVGWLRVLEVSESRACLLEKKMPLRWMRSMPGVHFVPASAQERRKILHTTCSPPPGSYPVQTYSTSTTPSTTDGWPHSPPIRLGHAVPTLAPGLESSGHGHSHGRGPEHGHGHSHGRGPEHGHGHSPEHGHGHSHGRGPEHGPGHSHECGHGHSHGHQHHGGGALMPAGPPRAHPDASPHVAVQVAARASHSDFQTSSRVGTRDATIHVGHDSNR